MTEKVRYRLTLKERPSGEVFFMLESRDDHELSIVEVNRAWLGIELRPGMSYAEAHQLWKPLSHIIEGLSYTVLPEPDLSPVAGDEAA